VPQTAAAPPHRPLTDNDREALFVMGLSLHST
jgi:hypothetical protein